MRQTRDLKADQRGIVSLLMTMVMMIIISLIVLGLAQMSRREQRQSLDNQLSLQAFYAAESGVNDAVTAAQKGGLDISDSGCNPTVGGINLSTTNVDTTNNVAYTCVLVSNGDDLHGDLSKVIIWPLQKKDASAIGTALFQWTPTPTPAASASLANCPTAATVGANTEFANNSNWNNQCPFGVLRLDLVPVNTVDQASLIDNTMTAFMVPTHSGGISSTSFNSGVTVYPVTCSASDCELKITGLGSKYYMRAISIYSSGDLTVSTPSGNFTGAQVTVDATGKAQDVLRRIKEDVNINTGNTNALGSQPIISGDSVCKRWAIYATGSINAANSIGECK